MSLFPNIKLENKEYPTAIMGEDHFTGWFEKCKKYNSEKERELEYRQTLESAYSLGVRGFSISPQQTLIKTLKKFKKENPDIICISNHHWHTNYYINKKSLWKAFDRLAPTEAYKFYQKNKEKSKWFNKNNYEKKFNKNEINEIKLDEKEYLEQLKTFNFCDFFLVGNIGRSALITLGRNDIVEQEIEIIRKQGKIPIGMCEGGGLAIQDYDSMNSAGNWIWINRSEACPNLRYTLKKIKETSKPLTAYRIFSGKEGFNLQKSIEFIKRINKIKSIVVGIDSKNQAIETFSELKKYWKKKKITYAAS